MSRANFILGKVMMITVALKLKDHFHVLALVFRGYGEKKVEAHTYVAVDRDVVPG